MNRLAFLLCFLSQWALAATYAPVTYTPTLSVSISGGDGTITSSPAGISCTLAGGTCNHAFTPGTPITLTATPSPSNASSTIHGTGTELQTWGGTACTGQSTSAPCTFTFFGGTTATAAFTPFDTDTWWISPTGSDSNDCRHFSHTTGTTGPCATWNHITTAMAAGDQLYFEDGNYLQMSIGTSAGASNTSNWVNGTVVKSTRVLGYTRSLCAPMCASSAGQAAIDARYQTAPLYIWKTSFIEVGYMTFLHSSGQPGTVDGTTSSGVVDASITVNCSGGGVNTLTINSGGSGFPGGSSWIGAIWNVTDAQIQFGTSAGGVVNSATVTTPGTGCTASTQADAAMRVSGIYIHDSGFAYSLPGTTGANLIGLDIGGCNSCVVERNWIWGYGSRYALAFYHGANNIMRQNVARYDGAPDGQPKAALVLYDEDNTTAENNIGLDFNNDTDSGSDNHASIFATCSSPLTQYPFGMGTIALYGNIAMNTVGTTSGVIQFDSACSIASGVTGATPSTLTFKDNVVSGSTGSTTAGLWLERDSPGTTNAGHHTFIINTTTLWNVNGNTDILRVDNSGWTAGTLENTIVDGNTFTSAGCYNQPWSGTPTSATNLWFDCNNTLHTALPSSSNANPAFTWLNEVLSGPAFGTGTPSGNIGATVVKMYNNGTLSGTNLWPFPNQAQSVADLCFGPDDAATPTVNAGSLTVGKNYIIGTVGTTSWTAIGASANTAGILFTATGAGSGTGVAYPNIFTRGHNVGPATTLCPSGMTLTNYVWEQATGTPSPF